MISDLKMGFKVIKYGLNFKANIFSMLLLLVLGCVMTIMTPTMPASGMYIGIGSIMVAQLIHSVAVSTMVQTSPYKKKLQTLIPAFYSGCYLLIANTVSVCLYVVGMHIMEWDIAEISNAILLMCGLMIIMLIYMGAAMKLFWPSTIVFFVAFMVYFMFMNIILDNMVGTELVMIMPLEMSILVSYVVVILASVLMYLIFYATYKLEYSKTTWEAALKRAK